MNNDLKVIMLINGDLIFGGASKGDKDTVVIENPYTVEDLGQGPCVMPYCLNKLMTPMKFLPFQAFNILWMKNLSEFPEVMEQYVSATTGIDIETKPNLEI